MRGKKKRVEMIGGECKTGEWKKMKVNEKTRTSVILYRGGTDANSHVIGFYEAV